MEITNKTKHDVIVEFNEVSQSKTRIVSKDTLQNNEPINKIDIVEVLVKKEEDL